MNVDSHHSSSQVTRVMRQATEFADFCGVCTSSWNSCWIQHCLVLSFIFQF